VFLVLVDLLEGAMTDTKWEVVASEKGVAGRSIDQTERLPVPGGWLYRTIRNQFGIGNRQDIVTMVFVPDGEA
jgi:hypothetical protein